MKVGIRKNMNPELGDQFTTGLFITPENYQDGIDLDELFGTEWASDGTIGVPLEAVRRSEGVGLPSIVEIQKVKIDVTNIAAEPLTASKAEEPEEHVLVVSRYLVDSLRLCQGINPVREVGRESALLFVAENQTFLKRSLVEHDENYKQLIPYCVFLHGDKVFTYQRTTLQGEERLHGKKSIGVGGHISTTDARTRETYVEGLAREIREEVNVVTDVLGSFCVGLIEDKASAVGRVHLGVLHIILVEYPLVTSNDDTAIDLGFVGIPELYADMSQFEQWSQDVICFLSQRFFQKGPKNWKDWNDVGVEYGDHGFPQPTKQDSPPSGSGDGFIDLRYFQSQPTG